MDQWIKLNDDHHPTTIKKFDSLYQIANLGNLPRHKKYSKNTYSIHKKNSIKRLPKLNNLDKDKVHNLIFLSQEKIAYIYGTNEKQQSFSYYKNLQEEIMRHIKTDLGQELVNNITYQKDYLKQNDSNGESLSVKILHDIEIINKQILFRTEVKDIIIAAEQFKKKSLHFKFKMQQTRILFHIILAQLAIQQKSIQKAIEEFHFCQYHSRKIGSIALTICFLWHISTIYLTISEYEPAIESIKHLIEMAVVSNKKNLIKHGLEKLSLIYYYMGNSFMSEYYEHKSEVGLCEFETQIYYKEYNGDDEIKRLQIILFDKNCSLKDHNKCPENDEIIRGELFSSFSLFPTIAKNGNKKHKYENEKDMQNINGFNNAASQYPKRKLNKKYELDINHQQNQKLGAKRSQFIENLNAMRKNYSNSKVGFMIQEVLQKNNKLGEIYSETVFSVKVENKNQSDKQNIFPKWGYKNRTNHQSIHVDKVLTQEETLNPIINQTRIIKSHLSRNRQNNPINSENRWRKLLAYQNLLLQKIKQIYFQNSNSNFTYISIKSGTEQKNRSLKLFNRANSLGP